MMEKRKTKFKREIKSSNIKYNMDPRELHKETVKLIKVLSNLRESDTMGAAIKKTQVKKTKKKLLDFISLLNLVFLFSIIKNSKLFIYYFLRYTLFAPLFIFT